MGCRNVCLRTEFYLPFFTLPGAAAACTRLGRRSALHGHDLVHDKPASSHFPCNQPSYAA